MKNITLIPVLLSTDDAKNDSVNGLLITNGRLHKPVAGGEYRRCIQNGSTANYLYLTSDAPIKEGDWVYEVSDKKIVKNKNEYLDSYHKGSFLKIEFSTDPKLIADGVPAIDANTKVIMPCIICKGNGCSSCDGLPYEVNFLTEFCKRWNEKKAFERLDEVWGDDKDGKYAELYKHHQKDSQKVDVEKLANEYSIKQQVESDGEYVRLQKAVEYGYNQALIKSQPKGDIVIECEMQTDWKESTKDIMAAYGDDPDDFEYEPTIKLKDGQPTLTFK